MTLSFSESSHFPPLFSLPISECTEAYLLFVLLLICVKSEFKSFFFVQNNMLKFLFLISKRRHWRLWQQHSNPKASVHFEMRERRSRSKFQFQPHFFLFCVSHQFSGHKQRDKESWNSCTRNIWLLFYLC